MNRYVMYVDHVAGQSEYDTNNTLKNSLSFCGIEIILRNSNDDRVITIYYIIDAHAHSEQPWTGTLKTHAPIISDLPKRSEEGSRLFVRL